MLFACVNVARRHNCDPELALRAATARFRERVELAERLADAEGVAFRGGGDAAAGALLSSGQAFSQGKPSDSDRIRARAPGPRLARQPDRRGRRRSPTTARFGRAAVPSGASTGSHEAVERRDGGAAYGGKAVEGAVASVNDELAPALVGHDVHDQRGVDRLLCEVDGTPDKGRIGANGVLGVSLAVAKASAAALGLPLWRSLGGPSAHVLPVPMMNVINGGAHADNALDLQEFMVVPHGATSFAEALRIGSEVYHALKARLHRDGLSTAVGDEGGFAPEISSAEAAIELILAAAGDAGHARAVGIALDPAMTELYRDGAYHVEGRALSSEQLVEWWRSCAAATRSSRSRTRCPRTTGTAGGCSPSAWAAGRSWSATISS